MISAKILLRLRSFRYYAPSVSDELGFIAFNKLENIIQEHGLQYLYSRFAQSQYRKNIFIYYPVLLYLVKSYLLRKFNLNSNLILIFPILFISSALVFFTLNILHVNTIDSLFISLAVFNFIIPRIPIDFTNARFVIPFASASIILIQSIGFSFDFSSSYTILSAPVIALLLIFFTYMSQFALQSFVVVGIINCLFMPNAFLSMFFGILLACSFSSVSLKLLAQLKMSRICATRINKVQTLNHVFSINLKHTASVLQNFLIPIKSWSLELGVALPKHSPLELLNAVPVICLLLIIFKIILWIRIFQYLHPCVLFLLHWLFHLIHF